MARGQQHLSKRKLQLGVTVAAFACMSAVGCSGSDVGVDIDIAVRGDGTLEERVVIRGVDTAVNVSGWSRESTAPAEFSRSFDDPSELPEAESQLLNNILRAVSEEIGYAPIVLDRSRIDVSVEDYLFFKSIDVAYRLPEIDFRPPHCLECEGRGRHVCTVCGQEGSVTCPTCSGMGEHDCPDCDAEGSRTCESCDGAGYRECSSCDARGWRECQRCDGSGTDGEGDSCSSCDGSGRRRCYNCNETGRRDCWSCSNTGEIECRRCGGDGQIECNECYGATLVSCDACEGEGVHVCHPCDGIGSPTSGDLAAYETALEDATVNFTIDVPGFVNQDSSTSWRLSSSEIISPEEMTASSRVLNWPLVLGSGGGLLALSILGVILTVRTIRRRPRMKGTAEVSPAAPTPAEEASVATIQTAGPSQVTCGKCGSPVDASAIFCTECGTRR